MADHVPRVELRKKANQATGTFNSRARPQGRALFIKCSWEGGLAPALFELRLAGGGNPAFLTATNASYPFRFTIAAESDGLRC